MSEYLSESISEDSEIDNDFMVVLKMLKKSIIKIKVYQNDLIETKRKNEALEKILLEKQKYINSLEKKLKQNSIL